MRKAKTILSLLFFLIILISVSAPALATAPSLNNGELRGEGTPEGWSVLSYLKDSGSVSAQEGVVTMILRSNKMNSAIATLRKEKIRISVEKYKGYVVDPKAVRTVEGDTGVYVKLGNIVRFRKIDIAYSDEDMVLATCPDGESGYLRQYDEIIIEGTDLYDGKNID